MQVLLIFLLWKAKAAMLSVKHHCLEADSEAATAHSQKRAPTVKVTLTSVLWQLMFPCL